MNPDDTATGLAVWGVVLGLVAAAVLTAALGEWFAYVAVAVAAVVTATIWYRV